MFFFLLDILRVWCAQLAGTQQQHTHTVQVYCNRSPVRLAPRWASSIGAYLRRLRLLLRVRAAPHFSPLLGPSVRRSVGRFVWHVQSYHPPTESFAAAAALAHLFVSLSLSLYNYKRKNPADYRPFALARRRCGAKPHPTGSSNRATEGRENKPSSTYSPPKAAPRWWSYHQQQRWCNFDLKNKTRFFIYHCAFHVPSIGSDDYRLIGVILPATSQRTLLLLLLLDTCRRAKGGCTVVSPPRAHRTVYTEKSKNKSPLEWKRR